MLFECKNCGAPLDVKEAKRRMKCRYCGVTELREKFRTIANETPTSFVQPKKWKPPSNVTADPNTTLEYSEPTSPFVVIGLVTIILAISIAIPVIWNSPRWNTKPSALVKAPPPTEAHAAVAKRLGGELSGTEVSVDLNSDRYADLEIRYADETDPIPTSFALEVDHRKKADPAARETLSSRLNGGLESQGDWNWGRAHMAANENGIFGDVPKDADPDLRKRQTAAMWTLILGAAFDASVQPTADEMRKALGGGYPVSDLSKIPSSTPLDKAKPLVELNFPGSLIQADTQVRATIALDHPAISSVELEWFFEPGGMISDAYFHGKSNFVAMRDRLAACYQKSFGEPSVTIENPLTGARTYTFHLGPIYIEVTQGVSFHEYGLHNVPAPIDSSQWITIVNAMNTCR